MWIIIILMMGLSIASTSFLLVAYHKNSQLWHSHFPAHEYLWDGLRTSTIRLPAIYLGIRPIFVEGSIFKHQGVFVLMFSLSLFFTIWATICCLFSQPATVFFNVFADFSLTTGLGVLVMNQVGTAMSPVAQRR
jgi:hypothetical protein